MNKRSFVARGSSGGTEGVDINYTKNSNSNNNNNNSKKDDDNDDIDDDEKEVKEVGRVSFAGSLYMMMMGGAAHNEERREETAALLHSSQDSDISIINEGEHNHNWKRFNGATNSNNNNSQFGYVRRDSCLAEEHGRNGIATKQDQIISAFWLTKYSSVLIGTQLAWALQVSYASAIFLKMGMKRQSLAYLRIPGPMTGLICQPLVGVMIDMDNNKRNSNNKHRPSPHTQQQKYTTATKEKESTTTTTPLSIIIVFVACACCFFGLILMASGDVIGASSGTQRQWLGCIIASIGLWTTDFGFNAADVAMRALTATNLPTSKQAAANGALAGAMGTGQIIGFMIGAIPMKAFIQRISGSQHVGDFEGNVLVACVIILVSFVCSWHTIMKLKLSGDFDRNNTLTDENPGCNQRRVHSHNNSNSNPDPLTLDNIENIDGMVLNGETDSSDGIVHHHEPNSSLEEYNDEEDSFMSTSVQSNSSSFCQLLAASYNLCSRDTPASFYAIALTTSLTWLAWFPYIYYATDFVAVYVFDGIPGRGGGEANEQYDAGVRFANLWLAINSVVVMISSRTFVPYFGKMHIGYTYVSGIAMLSILLGSFSFIGSNQTLMTSFIIMLLGLPWSISSSVPYALISMESNTTTSEKSTKKPSTVASLMGKLNVFVVLPGIAVLAVVYVMTPVGLTSRWLIRVGSLFGVLGTVYSAKSLKKMK